MKKENDEITDLFRSRLGNAEMTVRDGFWEELNSEMMVRSHHPESSFLSCSGSSFRTAGIGCFVGCFLVLLSESGDRRSFYPSGGCQRKYNTSGWRRGETGFYPYALRTGFG